MFSYKQKKHVLQVMLEEERSKIYSDNTSKEGMRIKDVEVRHDLGLSFLENTLCTPLQVIQSQRNKNNLILKLIYSKLF